MAMNYLIQTFSASASLVLSAISPENDHMWTKVGESYDDRIKTTAHDLSSVIGTASSGDYGFDGIFDEYQHRSRDCMKFVVDKTLRRKNMTTRELLLQLCSSYIYCLVFDLLCATKNRLNANNNLDVFRNPTSQDYAMMKIVLDLTGNRKYEMVS